MVVFRINLIRDSALPPERFSSMDAR